MQDEYESEARIVADLTHAGMQPRKVEDQDFVIVPNGHKVHDFDHLREQPRRIKADADLRTIESFIDYLVMFIDNTTIVIGDRHWANSREGIMLTGKLDYHAKDQPSHCTHNVRMIARKTPDWNAWVGKEHERMDQRSFKNWLKDNAHTIAEPELGALVEMIESVTINASGKLEAVSTHLKESRDKSTKVEIDSKLPEDIKLNLKPIYGSSDYSIKIRVQIIPDIGREEVSFMYTMINKDATLDHLFDDYVAKLKADISPITVLV